VFAVLVVGLLSEKRAQRSLGRIAPLPGAGTTAPGADEAPARLSA